MKEMSIEKEAVIDSEYSLSKVPQEKKTQDILAAMVVLVGFTFFTPSMTAGGNLGIGLSLKEFTISVIVGNAFLGIYCGTLAYIGQKTGLTLDLLGRHSFGNVGSYIPSSLISFTQVGWFGVGVAMFAIPVSKMTGVPVWILIIITGIIMTVTAYKGIKALAILGSIAVPLIAILGSYSVNWGVDKMGGFFKIFSENPANSLTLSSGIAIVVGSFISGGTATPNFTRFTKDAKKAVIATIVAFFIGNSIMMVFGAVGGAVTGVPDIFDILILQGLAIPATITLGLNIWTTNNNALYTAGLGISNITKINMKPMVLVGGGVGTVLAIWLYYNFVGFLNLLSGMIPPVGAVIILHYILHKEEYNSTDYIKDINMSGILSVVVGALIGIFMPIGIKPINSLISSGIVFIILDRFMKGDK
ncbi:cytosine permease [uncultured Fusobacterium sp.]|uniref:cytosine permease n=1 Tax=uncultured Fusobacterium sp. TaxID=159267 RepID=UPI0027DBC415|nr:cytosine permease [uncultured Fusobacterium sp.]